MNQEIKSQWTTALRSGDYAQAKGHLKTEQGYCCLGVLCQMAADRNVIPQPNQLDNGVFVYGDQDDHSHMFLPLSVQRWAGLEENTDGDNPMVLDEHGRYLYLAYLNDEAVPFDEIANLIDNSDL